MTAFGFSPGAMMGSSLADGAVSQGPPLEVIQTESLGFRSIAGDAKVRLTAPWPSPPQNIVSLLSIASRKGLVAAAAPDGVIMATTDSVRKAFESPKVADSDVRPFQPQLNISLPMRVSHLAFTSDENFLLLTAESGGGLAVYKVDSLLQGLTQTQFELSTNGEELRAISPNPTHERAELCAVVTSNGALHMANLNLGAFSGSLKSQVVCTSWSNKGKQLVSGHADGTILQMTPEGDVKATIPKPPNVGDYHVSSLLWLENNVFLSIHSSTNQSPPSSVYHIITRHSPSTFVFQQITDPVVPFGSQKVPRHYMLRLKEFAPNLQDLLIVSSTASSDVGLLTRSKSPLTNDKPSQSITDIFTTTELSDDTRRATLPMTESMDDSVPVGVALDLSSRDTVHKPIPTDEMDESKGPLPGFWLLTQEGILCAWWIVYDISVKQGLTYQGMAVAGALETMATPTQQQQNPTSISGSSTVASLGKATPSFGSATALGARVSPWGATSVSARPTGGPAFGQATFGNAEVTTAPFGSSQVFGQPANLVAKSSHWASVSTSPAAPTFGLTGLSGLNKTMSTGVFGGLSSSNSKLSPGDGFAGFAGSGGFASLAGEGKPSIFGGDKSNNTSLLSKMDTDTAFPPMKRDSTDSGRFAATPFAITSSFKPVSPEKLVDTSIQPSGSLFSSDFSSALRNTVKLSSTISSLSKSDDMAVVDNTTPVDREPKDRLATGLQPTTPSTNANSEGRFPSSNYESPTQDRLKISPGLKPAESSTDLLKIKTEVVNNGSGVPVPPETRSKSSYMLGESGSSSTASIFPDDRNGSSSPSHNVTTVRCLADSHLPVESTANSKGKPVKSTILMGSMISTGSVGLGNFHSSGETGNRSATKNIPVAPLPPDFLSVKGTGKVTSLVPLPTVPDDGDAEEGESEGSGVDVAKELSPESTGIMQTPGLTPQSSFGGMGTSAFSIPRSDDKPRPLFGEVTRQVPRFPPPVVGQSPRSPSPIRNAIPSRAVRQEPSRSVSAPGPISQAFDLPKMRQSNLGRSIVGREPSVDPFLQQQRQAQADREDAEERPLVDEQDAEMQRRLESEVEPSLILDEFIAHMDIVPPAQETVPSQVEAVYRDINSMIDTLGLNSRSVRAFIKGHSRKIFQDERSKEDLENLDDWVLCEIPELSDIIEDELAADLCGGRVQDLEGKLDACTELSRDLSRLRAEQDDLKRIILVRIDPQHAKLARSLPLTPGQMAQQNDLRREYAKFSQLLAEAEESLALLKARVVSSSASSGRPGAPLPTVDALIRTITKMTSMVEKRSGDVDVLETQMRRLRVAATPSRDNSPLMTPQKKSTVTGFSSLILQSPDAAMLTPRPNIRASVASPVSSAGIKGSPMRRKMSGFSREEKSALMQKLARRQAVLGKLEANVVKQGIQVLGMEDIE